MPTNTRLPGHTLAHEGAPHAVDGVRIPWRMSTLGSAQQGCAKCSCGFLSPVLPSTTPSDLTDAPTHTTGADR